MVGSGGYAVCEGGWFFIGWVIFKRCRANFWIPGYFRELRYVWGFVLLYICGRICSAAQSHADLY